jgi:hypothetical protein
VKKNENNEKKWKASQWAVQQVVENNIKITTEAARRATMLFDLHV